MQVNQIGPLVRVRLTEEARNRRLWAGQSDNAATIRGVVRNRGHVLVRVHVDGERLSRTRAMSLDNLELA